MTRLSIVIPAYNEARRLPRTLDAWLDFLSRQSYDAELIVADDGSTDATPSLVQDYTRRDPRVRLVRLPANQGKGGAVKAGMLAANGDFLFYVDADLNISPDHIPRALDYLGGASAALPPTPAPVTNAVPRGTHHGADVVAGQRSLASYAGQERSPGRLAAGAAVQIARRAIVLSVIRDTQCGFKGFRRETARTIFERTIITSFAFDIEVLFLARQLRAVIVEMPVTTEYRAESTFVLRKHLPPFLRDILRIRLNQFRGRYRLPDRTTT